jgi:hypothetical protein
MRQLSNQEVQAVSGAATNAKPTYPLLQLIALPFAAIYATAVFNAIGGGGVSYFEVLSQGFDQIFTKK